MIIHNIIIGIHEYAITYPKHNSSEHLNTRVKIEDEGEYSVTVRGRRNDGGYIDKSAQIILTLLGLFSEIHCSNLFVVSFQSLCRDDMFVVMPCGLIITADKMMRYHFLLICSSSNIDWLALK